MEKPKADAEVKLESQAKDPVQNPLSQPDLKPSDIAVNGGGDASDAVVGLSEEPKLQVQIESKGGESAVQAPGGGSPKKSVHWNPELVSESSGADQNNVTVSSNRSNAYTDRSSAATPASYSVKDTMESVKGALWTWGRKVGEATRKAEDLAGNTWQHLKTAPSFADAAMGRIAQSTKVLAEGGYEKIFRQTFETVPEEELRNSFACYLSTSAGPVMGTLYLSTAKLAFCSDNPLSYKNGSETEWSYYKVVIPLHQLKAANPSTSIASPSEKYIQVISVDSHEFWFMGFFNYIAAVDALQEALNSRALQSV